MFRFSLTFQRLIWGAQDCTQSPYKVAFCHCCFLCLLMSCCTVTFLMTPWGGSLTRGGVRSPQPLPVGSRTHPLYFPAACFICFHERSHNTYSFPWIPWPHTLFYIYFHHLTLLFPSSISKFCFWPISPTQQVAPVFLQPHASICTLIWFQLSAPLSQAPHAHVHVHGLPRGSACALAPSWPVFGLFCGAAPPWKSPLITAHLQPQSCPPPRAPVRGQN